MNNTQLRNFLTKAVTDVFGTMVSMKVELLDSNTTANLEGERLVGSVGFAGRATGAVYIHVTEAFARQMTGAMLGMKPDEVKNMADVQDAVGEVSNMIGGNLKSHLADNGLSCVLSIPSITRGSDFRIEAVGAAQQQRLVFCPQQADTVVIVEVYFKADQ
ncbi:MAG: chemotaxis protein CheX [Verrucomicrobia bacterium]|nr:chemotaxis protein CheX [Verrucomicrobiota bacterium]